MELLLTLKRSKELEAFITNGVVKASTTVRHFAKILLHFEPLAVVAELGHERPVRFVRLEHRGPPRTTTVKAFAGH